MAVGSKWKGKVIGASSSGRQPFASTLDGPSLPDQNGLVTKKRNKGYDTKDMAFNLFKKKGKKKDEVAAADADNGVIEQEDEPQAEEIVESGATAGASDAGSDQAAPGEKTPSGFMNRFRKGLSKTREILTTDIDELFLGRKKVDDELLEDLEALLITADMGVETTMELMERLSGKAKKISDAGQLKAVLKEEILALMQYMPPAPEMSIEKPHVIMVVGVNGVGKTTTIGKLAARFQSEGKKTLVAAADTFRAAAVEQLGIWADRAGAQFVRGKDQADPAAIAFDAMGASVARGIDIALIDTAGRLHTNVNLMEEVKKIKRAVAKKMPGAPHEVLLVLDASTGQNAVSQANMFNDAVGVTGMALTKLDGTAKGGIVVSICNNLKIPLQYVGIGEKIEDLQDFNPEQFVEALF